MAAPNQQRWLELWRRIASHGDGRATYTELVTRYAEPQRHYHNLTHISECLAELDPALQQSADPPALEMALWFHDAIYDPRAKDNEEESARLAEKHLLTAGAPTGFIESVRALVLATRHHDPSLHRDAPIMVDIDLSILGKPRGRFDEYERQIRHEYDWVPEPAFRTGRSAILQAFLARPHLYATDLFRDKYEVLARENLAHSLHALRDP